MKMFNRRKQAAQSTGNPVLRGRDSQRRPMPVVGQNRTFSYYAARSQSEVAFGRETAQEKPPIRRLPTRLQRLRKHSGWLLAFMVALAGLIYELQLSTLPKVVSLVSATEAPFLQESQVYQLAAQQMFAESAANRNKLTVDANAIAARLRERFPELQEVSIALPILGDRPTIYIRPAAPAMVLAASNGTYIVDENGRALADAKAGTNISRLRIPSVTDQSGLAVELGQQVLPRSATAFISRITGQLRSQQLNPQSMTLPAAAGELDVYIAGKPFFVKFNLEKGGAESALVQSGTLLAVLKKLEREAKQPAQYIDVRLEGRAYYK